MISWRTSRNAQICSMPALYLIDSAQPSAFATGRDLQHAAVAITSGLLALLAKKEAAGTVRAASRNRASLHRQSLARC